MYSRLTRSPPVLEGVRSDRDPSGLASRLGIPPEHVLLFEATSGVMQPAHFVALDVAHSQVVLALRGAKHPICFRVL